jgi:phosphoribosylanthranilate isomerase
VKALVKICGVTLDDDVTVAASAGASFIGVNLWPASKRHVTVERAAELALGARAASPMIRIVGVFVDAGVDEIARAVTGVDLDVVQLHGDETPETCAAVADATGVAVWKALAVAGDADIADLARWPVDAILLDAPSPGRGGSGVPIDRALARRAAESGARIVLAGGLTAETVASAIADVGPWAVDVASGVERAPGVKDHDRVRAFIAASRT